MTANEQPIMFSYLVSRDKAGDVMEVRRFRKARAALVERERLVLKKRDHQPSVTIDIYSGESFRQATGDAL